MLPAASVIIINHNGRRFLDELLQTLHSQTLQSFETLLIDNHSQDKSVSYVRNNFPWVCVIPQSENLGFSRAANLGATGAKADHLVFLNTDMKLDRGWLEALLATVEKDKSTAVVASKNRLYHQPGSLNGVGGAMNYLGYSWDRGMFQEDRSQYDRSEEVLFASAGAALFRRSVFLDAGGFDEKFFMYHEDVDLCWRLWILGFRVVTAPQTVVYHHFGASTRETQGMLWRELAGERHSIRSLIKKLSTAQLDAGSARPAPPASALRAQVGAGQKLPVEPSPAGQHAPAEALDSKNRKRTDAEIKYLIVQSRNVPIRL